MKKSISKNTGRVHWDLIRDLAWLASGKKMRLPDERTVRRYLEQQRGAKDPASDYWKRSWELLGKAIRLAPGRQHTPFEDAAREYLHANDGADSIPQKAARKRRKTQIRAETPKGKK